MWHACLHIQKKKGIPRPLPHGLLRPLSGLHVRPPPRNRHAGNRRCNRRCNRRSTATPHLCHHPRTRRCTSNLSRHPPPHRHEHARIFMDFLIALRLRMRPCVPPFFVCAPTRFCYCGNEALALTPPRRGRRAATAPTTTTTTTGSTLMTPRSATRKTPRNTSSLSIGRLPPCPPLGTAMCCPVTDRDTYISPRPALMPAA